MSSSQKGKMVESAGKTSATTSNVVILNEQIQKVLGQATISEKSLQKLKQLYAELKAREHHIVLNQTHIRDDVLPKLNANVATLQTDIDVLREAKDKSDISIQRLKTLAQELNRKIDSALQDSKRSQQEEQKIREGMIRCIIPWFHFERPLSVPQPNRKHFQKRLKLFRQDYKL